MRLCIKSIFLNIAVLHGVVESVFEAQLWATYPTLAVEPGEKYLFGEAVVVH